MPQFTTNKLKVGLSFSDMYFISVKRSL